MITIQLTADDVDVLTDALASWEDKDASGQMMSELMGALLIPRDSAEAKAKWDAELLQERAKSDAKKRARAERSILLKAKLLMARREQDTDRVLDSVTSIR